MKISDLYYWQVELADGTIFSQWADDGTECTWKDVKNLDKIVRASLISKIPSLPRHDCIIDIDNGHRFIRRFGRGFLKMNEGFKLNRYLHCIVTNKYRLWVFPDGRCIITPPDQEIRL